MFSLVKTDVTVTGDEPVADSSVKTCSVCRKTKPIEQFYRWRSTRDGRMARCADCSRDAVKKTVRAMDWTKRLVHHARHQHRYLKFMGTSDLTADLLFERYRTQEGRCAWFGVPLTLELGSGLTQVSLDRLDNGRGYLADNVALVCRAANLARNNASMEEFEIFVGMLGTSLNRSK